MDKYQAVIFDLDGTLINSLEDIADSMNHTLIKFGFPTHPCESYKYFVGNGLKNLISTCLPEDQRKEETIENCYEAMMIEYGKNYLNKTDLYPGISDLLTTLATQNIKMAVLSNKADEITKKICNKLLRKWNFEVIMGANDLFPRKPHPDSAIHIAQSINVSTNNILYVGDTSIDMKTAVRAQMFPVGVTWGFRKKEELLEHGAQLIIDNPIELLDKII